MQSQLHGVARDRSMYQKIATFLASSGYELTWQQLQDKKKKKKKKKKTPHIEV